MNTNRSETRRLVVQRVLNKRGRLHTTIVVITFTVRINRVGNVFESGRVHLRIRS